MRERKNKIRDHMTEHYYMSPEIWNKNSPHYDSWCAMRTRGLVKKDAELLIISCIIIVVLVFCVLFF